MMISFLKKIFSFPSRVEASAASNVSSNQSFLHFKDGPSAFKYSIEHFNLKSLSQNVETIGLIKQVSEPDDGIIHFIVDIVAASGKIRSAHGMMNEAFYPDPPKRHDLVLVMINEVFQKSDPSTSFAIKVSIMSKLSYEFEINKGIFKVSKDYSIAI